jgi:hypothetical protein
MSGIVKDVLAWWIVSICNRLGRGTKGVKGEANDVPRLML